MGDYMFPNDHEFFLFLLRREEEMYPNETVKERCRRVLKEDDDAAVAFLKKLKFQETMTTWSTAPSSQDFWVYKEFLSLNKCHSLVFIVIPYYYWSPN